MNGERSCEPARLSGRPMSRGTLGRLIVLAVAAVMAVASTGLVDPDEIARDR